MFPGDIDVALERRAAMGTFEVRLSPRWTLQGGAGGLLWGSLRAGHERHHFGPGAAVSAAVTYRLLDGSGSLPFMLFSGSLSAAFARTHRDTPAAPEVAYSAVDIRLGALLGKTFFNALSPYIAARAFGGPIFWRLHDEAQGGTDRYHFQLGAGLVVALPMGLDAFAEATPLGERSVTCGVGFAF